MQKVSQELITTRTGLRPRHFVGYLIVSLILVALSLPVCATQIYFTASDFSVVIQPVQPSVQPGQVMTFDAILYNNSSQTADFGTGGNIRLYAVGATPEIDGNNLLSSPYVSSINFPIQVDQTIAPGGSVEVPFMTVDTLPSIPVGSVVTTGAGNWSFQNNPPSTSNPFVDFYIPETPGSEIVAVPEPNTSLLGGLPLLLAALRRVKTASRVRRAK